MSYYRYKHPVQLDTLALVQYLHSAGKDYRPVRIYEINHPDEITELPSIWDVRTRQLFTGYDACVRYFESVTGISDLHGLSTAFKEQNMKYRIGDNVLGTSLSKQHGA